MQLLDDGFEGLAAPFYTLRYLVWDLTYLLSNLVSVLHLYL